MRRSERKAKRQREAVERQAAWDALSNEEKADKVHARTGRVTDEERRLRKEAS